MAKREFDIGEKANMRQYIINRYTREGVIPREIFKLFSNLSEEEIINNIIKICKNYTDIETPIRSKTIPNLYKVYEKAEPNQNDQDVTITCIRKNYPVIQHFAYFDDMSRDYINSILRMSVRFYTSNETDNIEEVIRKIPDFTEYNCLLLTGYFNQQLTTLIVLNSVFRRETKDSYSLYYLNTDEIEFGRIYSEMVFALNNSGLDYKNDIKLIMVSLQTFIGLFTIKNNLRRSYYVKYALLKTNQNIDNEGIFVKYEPGYEKEMREYNFRPYGHPNELKETKILDKEKKQYQIAMTNLNEPIIKKKIFSKLKTSELDMSSLSQINRYVNEEDSDKLREIFPGLLNTEGVIFSELFNSTRREKEDINEETNKQQINDLLDTLCDLEDGKMSEEE